MYVYKNMFIKIHPGVHVCLKWHKRHRHTHSWSVPSAYVIVSGPLWVRAVLEKGKADFGEHPADTLVLASHDTELPLLSQDTTWGFPCAMWDYHWNTLVPHYPPTAFQKTTPTTTKGLAFLQGQGNVRRQGSCLPLLPSC